MSLRIPGPLNTALDAASGRPGVVTVAVVLALMTVVAWLWGPAWTVYGAAISLAVYSTATYHVTRVWALREQVRQRDYDNAALQAQISELAAGDASALTAQFRAIGESGEPR